MTQQSNRLSQFWQELKRRNVIRVITVYAASAFVVLELVDIITDPFGLPGWTLKLVVVLLAVGLLVAIILSWIYDIHPEGGMVKTEPAHKVKPEDVPKSSNGWKIASYISFVVIVGLILWKIFDSGTGSVIDPELEKSIAVLPFSNFSTDPDQEPMCLGLTNEIINNLYKIKSFDKVSSFMSVMAYRDSFNRPEEIAEELNVQYVLQGSYTKIGSDLRITTQLIDSGSDTYIWQEEYNQPYEEIISIQADIALQIATSIDAFITDEEKERIRHIPTTDQKAYELLQQANIMIDDMYTENPGDVLRKLVSFAQDAIDRDPRYAKAYAWAGLWNLYQGVYLGDKELTRCAWEAIPYLEKALELDPECSDAHLGMGHIYEWVQWDFIKAEEAYRQVNLLLPNKPDNYTLLADFYLKMNQLESIPSMLEIEGIQFAIPALVEVLKGFRPEAKKKLDSLSSKAQHQGEWHLLPYLAEGYIWAQEFDSAWSCIEKTLDPDSKILSIPRFEAMRALLHFKRSEPAQAAGIINRLANKSEHTTAGSPAYFAGWYYSWIGEPDSAFVWLEKAFENRSPEMPWLKVDPAFNNLKEDSRYWDLYERTGHKAYDDYMAGRKE